MRMDGLNLFNKIMFVGLLSACASKQPVESLSMPEDKSEEIVNKYIIGDCLMLIDPPSNIWKSNHFVKVEKIDLLNKRYYYRWHLGHKWDSGLSSAVGKFSVLEKITQKIDCNLIKVRTKNSDK